MSVFKALAGAVTINLVVFCTMTIKAFEFEFEFEHKRSPLWGIDRILNGYLHATKKENPFYIQYLPL